MKRWLLITTVILSVLVLAFFVNREYQTKMLFQAIYDNDYKEVKKRIDRGAYINRNKLLIYYPELNMLNPTPLCSACSEGNEEIVKLLIKRGADVNKRDNCTNQLPLREVFIGGKSNRFDLAFILIENGLRIPVSEIKEKYLGLSLYIFPEDSEETIERGFEFFKYLLETSKIDISNLELGLKDNALTASASNNNCNAIRYILEKDLMDVDSYDVKGDTPLISAVKNEQKDAVSLLIEFGADKSLADADGKTALDCAIEKGNQEIIDLLSQE